MLDSFDSLSSKPGFNGIASFNPSLLKQEKEKIVWNVNEHAIEVFKDVSDAEEFVKDHPGCMRGEPVVKRMVYFINTNAKKLTEELSGLQNELEVQLKNQLKTHLNTSSLPTDELNKMEKKLSGLIQNLTIKVNGLKLIKSESLDTLKGQIESLKELHSKILERKNYDVYDYNPMVLLMSMSGKDWSDRNNVSILNKKMELYSMECVPKKDPTKNAGFLEKHELPRDTQIAVIGDIHGDDFRLETTLDALQELDFLDDNYRCLPGKEIVFLGDYADRGANSLKVLELIMTLKMENKENIHLIRGNHEDLNTTLGHLDHYAANDPKYKAYLSDKANLSVIDSFYKSLPVGVYLGVKGENDKKEFIQFSHGLFHLYTDPAALLQKKEPHSHIWVDGSSGFSNRIKKFIDEIPQGTVLSKKEIKQREAIKKLQDLEKGIKISFTDVYWLDVGLKLKVRKDTGRVEIPPELISAYLRISGTETDVVKQIYRGHQGAVWSIKGENQKVLATTIDPSKDDTQQVFAVLKTANKVKDWESELLTLSLSSATEDDSDENSDL